MKAYTEEWVVIINKTKYTLTEEQAEVVRQAQLQNNRGVIVFPEFSINLPFVEEFYLSKKIYNKLPQIDNPEHKPFTEEQLKKNREFIARIKKNLADQYNLHFKKNT